MLQVNIINFLRFSRKFNPDIARATLYYTRNIEYPACFNALGLKEGMRILDIGSGNSVFPVYLAERGITVYATDIDEYVLELREAVKKAGFGYLLDNGKLNIQVCDARKLSFPEGFFDRVIAVSTLEHIPMDGDIAATKEIWRVLKKEGKAFLSVEANKNFMEMSVTHDFYYGYPYKEIAQSLNNNLNYANNYKEFKDNDNMKSLGFVRYYNKAAILERIVKPSGLQWDEIRCFADKFLPLRRILDTTFLGARFAWFVPFLAKLFYRNIRIEDLKKSSSYPSNAIACILLRK